MEIPNEILCMSAPYVLTSSIYLIQKKRRYTPCLISRKVVDNMKTFLPCALLIVSSGMMQGAILESISLNLSDLHAGSTLSGFTLSDSPIVGDTAPILLSFSDPSNYSPMSLMATITIESGTPGGFAVDFSDLIFTDLSGTVTPINTRDVDLMRLAFANCESFPCTATGGFQDGCRALSDLLFQPIIVMQSTEDRLGSDAVIDGKLMPMSACRNIRLDGFRCTRA
jgi:hypothetical protein